MTLTNFPHQWLAAKFTDVLDVQGGTQPPKSQFVGEPANGYVRLLQIRDFGSKPVPTYVPDTPKLKKVTYSDVLIGRYGASLGRICTGMEGAYNVALAKVISTDHLYIPFLRRYLESELFQAPLKLLSRSAQNGFNKDDLSQFDFPVTSLAEQKVIAEKLDILLAQVEATKARLESTLETLKQFRQSVLAAAVSGKLTEGWRSENPSLDSIELGEIGAYWTEQYKISGKRLPKLKLHETEALDGLPDTWLDTKIGHVFDVHVGATPSRSNNDYWDGGINWVSSSEVAFCRISSTKETITESGLNNTSTNLHPPGTVMLAMIGQGKTRGQAAILDIEACHNQNTAALRVPEGFAVSEFLYFFLTKQYEETRRVGGGNNQKALNKSFVQSLPFPLPPIEEQKEIVKCVEKLFTGADATEQQVNQALERVNNLTQSILAKAFRGELTEQWRKENPELISGDNSAEALLKKIKAERAAAKPKRKARTTSA